MKRWVKLSTGLVVEAEQVAEDTVLSLSAWANDAQIVTERDPVTNEELKALNIETPNGMMRASDGDYVIKMGGQFFTSKPGAFMHYYALLTDETVLNVPVEPVELVYYGDDGERQVIGTAEVTDEEGGLGVAAEVTDERWKKLLGGEFKGSMPKEI